MDWLGIVFIMVGVYLIGSKKRIGFLSSLFGNVLWIYFGYSTGIVSVIAINTIFLFLNSRGFINWGH